MSEPSPDVKRNAALRAALRTRWPSATFSVRNGRFQRVSVTWTDGPPEPAVWRIVNEGRARDRSVWWDANLERRVTSELVAVSYLRAQEARESFYSERDLQTGTPASWAGCWNKLDAADITDRDRRRAHLILTLAGDALPTDGDVAAQMLGRAVMRHGAILDAVLT